MATLDCRPRIELAVTFALTEEEARAMDALVGYGDDSFIKAFYEKLGEAYMRPHEDGLRSLFKSIRDQLPQILSRVDAARKAFEPEFCGCSWVRCDRNERKTNDRPTE